MSSRTPPKLKHLSVVKDTGRVGPRARVVSPEALSSEQNHLASHYQILAGTKGIIVGAIIGEATWDVRPLLLDAGKVSVLRFSNPALSLQREKYSALKSLFSRAMSLPQAAQIVAQGESDGQIWVRRKFFQSMLSDTPVDGDLVAGQHPVQLCHKLIRLVRTLHQSGIIHGHLTLTNLAIDEDRPVVVDFGFQSVTPDAQRASADLAPELTMGELPTGASDIYGLGTILHQLLASRLPPEHIQLVDAMRDQDPINRPDLEAVVSALLPEEHNTPASISKMGQIPRKQLRSGKLLGSSSENSSNQNLLSSQDTRNFDPHAYAGQNYNQASYQENTNPPQQPRQSAPLSSRNNLIRTQASPTIPVGSNSEQQALATPANPQDLKPWFFIAGLVLAVLLVPRLLNWNSNETEEEGDQISYVEYWNSRQPSMMQRVAQAALQDHDAEARMAIVADVMKGESPPSVRAQLIRTAFSPAWEAALSNDDRELAIALALSALYTDEELELPPIANAHPGVILAIVGDLGLSQGGEEFGSIPLSRLAEMPAPYGMVFSELEKLKLGSLGTTPSRAACHLLVGDTNTETLQAYFGVDSHDSVILARLRALLPALEQLPNLGEAIWQFIGTRDSIAGRMVGWFTEEDGAQWIKLPKSVLLGMVTGITPDRGITHEQYADLLRFPISLVRENAVQVLEAEFSDKNHNTLEFLSSSSNRLTRYQTITLISAFRLDSETSASILGGWFKSSPDAQSVLALMLARQNFNGLDPYSAEAPRYLAKTNWNASLSQLELMVQHPLALVRTLAYSKLNPQRAEEKELLIKAAQIEPDKRIRTELQSKLE